MTAQKLSKMERWEQALEQYETRRQLQKWLNILAHANSGSREYRQRCYSVSKRVEQSVQRWATYCNDIAPARYKR